MKRYLIILIVVLCGLNLYAQKNTFEISINKANVYTPYEAYLKDNIFQYDKPNIYSVEIRFQRSISNNIIFFTQYIRIPALKAVKYYAQVRNQIASESTGKLVNHWQYNFIDFGVLYKVFQYKRHRFSANGGLSLAFGHDEYLLYAHWIYGPDYPEWGHLVSSETYTQKATYWGVLAGVKYDYMFWKNRINVGPEFSARYYTKGFPYQFSYGLHVGYNF